MKFAWRALVAVCCQQAMAITVTVPGTANPWLAGMPDGADGLGGDSAPDHSPVIVPGLALEEGVRLQFKATGAVGRAPGYSGKSPDGSAGTNRRATNGISQSLAPFESLIGVFLGPEEPHLNKAPVGLEFADATDLDYQTIQPHLKQVFFIGDGLDRSGSAQTIVAPTGATRLFLGMMDSSSWHNNVGEFAVSIESFPAEQPPVISEAVNAMRWEVSAGGNGHYYEFLPFRLTWDMAQVAAQNRRLANLTGYLATPSSAEESAFITSILPPSADSVWIGIKEEMEGLWVWSGGPDHSEAVGPYLGWTTGGPSSSRIENVVSLNGPEAASGAIGKWQTVSATTPNQYVVEYSPELNETEPPPRRTETQFVYGGLLKEIWHNLPGNKLSNLTNHVRFLQEPDVVDIAELFEVPRMIAVDNFGSRLSGYIYAPTTGDYTFHMASDDNGALFLSTDQRSSSKRLIASEPDWAGAREWTGTARGRNPSNPENISAPIHLKSGRWYYIEALSKEGGNGADYLGVTWRPPGAAPINNGDTPIPGKFLATFADPELATDVQVSDAPAPIEIPLEISVQPQHAVIAPGDSVRFEVQAVGVGPLEFQWRFDDSPIPGETSPNLSFIDVPPDQSGLYDVSITDANGNSIRSRKTNLAVIASSDETQSMIARTVADRSVRISHTAVVPFVPPWGDGRSRRNGIILAANPQFQELGSVWEFDYLTRDPGIQLIHPFADGHVVVTIQRNSIGLSSPEKWTEIGYGNGDSSSVTRLDEFESVFPIVDGQRYKIKSVLTPNGEFFLFMDDKLVAVGTSPPAHQIDFRIDADNGFPGGSGWNREPFTGDGFPEIWPTGAAGIIVEPVDNSTNSASNIIFSPGPLPLPIITRQPSNTEVVAGKTAVLSVEAEGT
ncbi:PA14 domain-containing protein [bacterium]|nr:PA14 domain-containing protein [bacterium]